MSRQRSLNHRSSKPALLALVSALTIVASGCSNLPTAPTDPMAPMDSSAPRSPKVLPTGDAATSTYTWTTIASKSLSKGEAATVSGGRYQIQFVRGSLGASAVVAIMERDPAVPDVVLGPNPTALAKAATLTISYAGTTMAASPEMLKLWRLNDVTGAWELVVATNDLAAQKFSAKVSVLCRYAVCLTDPTKAGW